MKTDPRQPPLTGNSHLFTSNIRDSLLASTFSLGSAVAKEMRRSGSSARIVERLVESREIYILPHPNVAVESIAHFFHTHSPTRFVIINLSDIAYDFEGHEQATVAFEKIVVLRGGEKGRFPFITFKEVVELCLTGKKWLAADSQNAIAVHGGPNSFNAAVVFLALFLVWIGICDRISDAFRYIYKAIQRIQPLDVSTRTDKSNSSICLPFSLFPSEKAIIRWMLAVMRGKYEVLHRRLILRKVSLRGIPLKEYFNCKLTNIPDTQLTHSTMNADICQHRSQSIPDITSNHEFYIELMNRCGDIYDIIQLNNSKLPSSNVIPVASDVTPVVSGIIPVVSGIIPVVSTTKKGCYRVTRGEGINSCDVECNVTFTGDLLIRLLLYSEDTMSHLPYLRAVVNSDFIPKDGCIRLGGTDLDGANEFVEWMDCNRLQSNCFTEKDKATALDELSITLVCEEIRADVDGDGLEARRDDVDLYISQNMKYELELFKYYKTLHNEMKQNKLSGCSVENVKGKDVICEEDKYIFPVFALLSGEGSELNLAKTFQFVNGDYLWNKLRDNFAELTKQVVTSDGPTIIQEGEQNRLPVTDEINATSSRPVPTADTKSESNKTKAMRFSTLQQNCTRIPTDDTVAVAPEEIPELMLLQKAADSRYAPFMENCLTPDNTAEQRSKNEDSEISLEAYRIDNCCRIPQLVKFSSADKKQNEINADDIVPQLEVFRSPCK